MDTQMHRQNAPFYPPHGPPNAPPKTPLFWRFLTLFLMFFDNFCDNFMHHFWQSPFLHVTFITVFYDITKKWCFYTPIFSDIFDPFLGIWVAV